MTEMTFMNKRCSESDLVVFGFRNLYISAADLERATLGIDGLLLAVRVF